MCRAVIYKIITKVDLYNTLILKTTIYLQYLQNFLQKTLFSMDGYRIYKGSICTFCKNIMRKLIQNIAK
jgi:hypothetical protein